MTITGISREFAFRFRLTKVNRKQGDTGMIDADLWRRVRWFRDHGCGLREALSNARAEQGAERRGLRVVWEDETDSYESVYGEPMPDDADGPFWAWVPHPDAPSEPRDRRWPIASLGMVTLAKTVGRDPYARIVEAELYAEALDVLDGEDEEAAHVLAQRATYAGVL